MNLLGKTIVIIGLVITATGLILLLAPKIPFLGRLPGDIYYKKENFSFYLPLTTSIVLSIIISLILYLISRR